MPPVAMWAIRRSFTSCPASGGGADAMIVFCPALPEARGLTTGGASAIGGGDAKEGIFGAAAKAVTGVAGAADMLCTEGAAFEYTPPGL